MSRKISAAIVFGLALLLGNTTQAATQYPGYTLCASGTTAYLLDANGTSVHTWKGAGSVMACAYLLEDGSVLFPSRNCNGRHDGAYASGRFQKISWDGAILWDFTFCTNNLTPGYDVEPMPNGNVLIPCENSSGPGTIIELKPTGTTTADTVWKYTLPDSLEVDGTYINSVSYNPQLDQILIDQQEPSKRLIVIDHSKPTGGIIFTYTNSSEFNARLHAAMWSHKYFLGTNTVIPDADTTAMRINNLLVVSNGKGGIEVNPTTKKSVKTIAYTYSQHEGVIQRLPNGNALVTPGGSRTIVELADDGTTVKTFSAPASISRAFRYGTAFKGLSKLTSGIAAKDIANKTSSSSLIKFNNSVLSFTNNAGSAVELRIIGMDGKVVKTFHSNESVIRLSTSDLIAGSYIVEASHNGGIARQSIVKM